jgi:hypothetical protein
VAETFTRIGQETDRSVHARNLPCITAVLSTGIFLVFCFEIIFFHCSSSTMGGFNDQVQKAQHGAA